jgi:hypothetical protein
MEMTTGKMVRSRHNTWQGFPMIRAIMEKSFLLLFVLSLSIIGSTATRSFFTNYHSTLTVSDFAVIGNRLYVASSGGLTILDKKSGRTEFFSDIEIFPDIRLSALCARDGALWIGTEKGYLYRYDTDGSVKVYSSYYIYEWDILDIKSYTDYLLIASSQGCSVFDPEKEVAIKNATKFDTLSTPIVYTLDTYNDTLFLGCEGAIATLYIGGDNIEKQNFFDQGIWNLVHTGMPVQGFKKTKKTLAPQPFPYTTFKGKPVTTDSAFIYRYSEKDSSKDSTLRFRVLYDGEEAYTTGSRFIALYNDDDTYCWIGTDGDYYFRWDGTGEPKHYTIEGPTISIINSIHADREGTVWFTPSIQPYKSLWYQGVGKFDGREWSIYNGTWYEDNRYGNYTYNFGILGGNKDFRGIYEDSKGNMWFGTSGGNLKVFYKSSGLWQRFYIGAEDSSSFYMLDYTIIVEDLLGWGKSDAIVQDIGGYLWIANWKNYTGCLICYPPVYEPDPTESDPVDAHYRRFFPRGSEAYMENIVSLSVDHNNRIFAGSDQGKLVIFSYSGDPLQADLTLHYVSKENEFGRVNDMARSFDNDTWIATAKGIYRYYSDEAELVIVDSVLRNVTCIALEDDTTFWFGTMGSGLIRYTPPGNGRRGGAVKKYITEDNGLISNMVNDLSFDRKNGYLWIATADGISRYDIGHKFNYVPDNKGIFIYPNPYSFKKHGVRQIVFENVAPHSNVYICDISGVLIEKLQPLNQQSNFAWRFAWKPSRRIVPGTYLYITDAGKNSPVGEGNARAVGKFLIIP